MQGGRLPIARLSLSGELARPRPCDGLASCPSIASHRIGQGAHGGGVVSARCRPRRICCQLSSWPSAGQVRGRSRGGVWAVRSTVADEGRCFAGSLFFPPSSSSRVVMCAVLVYAQNIRVFRVPPSVVVDARSTSEAERHRRAPRRLGRRLLTFHSGARPRRPQKLARPRYYLAPIIGLVLSLFASSLPGCLPASGSRATRRTRWPPWAASPARARSFCSAPSGTSTSTAAMLTRPCRAHS
jgi:hypothetical protein